MALDPDMLDTHRTAHLVFADGSEYRGFVRDGVIDGLGMLFDAAGNEVYVGEYRNGLKSGYGSYNFPDGSKYYGDWVNDTMEGKQYGLGELSTLAPHPDFSNHTRGTCRTL